MNEIVDGKRTFIERRGAAFELPEGHRVTLTTGDAGEPETIALAAGTSGSTTLWIASIDEEADRVTVHLGAEVGRTGGAEMLAPGAKMPEARGYPFPSA